MNFKEALIAHLQGKKVEALYDSHTAFVPFEKAHAYVPLDMADCPLWSGGFEYRLAPRKIMIGDVECEAPIKELAKGQVCYLLNIPDEKLEQPAQAFMHRNDIASAVSKGMMFATPEAALAAGIAVSKILTQE